MTASPSRILLLAALLALLLSATWSVRTPPAPGADRYDYVGCAYHAVQGHGLRQLVEYPLRFAFPGAQTLPAQNLTRPPVWPALLAPLVRAGAGDRAGVLLAVVCGAALLWLLALAGERTFGEGAGGAAALAMASSFAVTRALWGGGPELAMALVTYTLWTWSPREQGRAAHLACGSLYGVLPLLHPFGWVLGALALVARGGRYARGQRGWLLAGALAVALPWHLRAWAVAGTPGLYVQSSAELAKEVFDPAGMGPYRGLTPMPTLEVVAHHPTQVLATWGRHLRHLATHVDQWLAWPLLVLAVLGARQAPRLARRDALVLAAGGLAVGFWSLEARLLLPLLPVACTWVGAAVATLPRRVRGLPMALAMVLLCAAPWVLPLGRALRPGAELAGLPLEARDPPPRLLQALQSAGDVSAPFFTDSSAIAWRARRNAVLLPATPGLLDTLRTLPALRRARVLALTEGRASTWTRGASAQWNALLSAATTVDQLPGGAVIVRLPERAPEAGAPIPSAPAPADRQTDRRPPP